MDKEKITYEELVAYLAKTVPAPEDPAGLTREIMTRVERAGGRERPHAVVRLAGWTSGIAAALLFALLAGEVSWTPRVAAPVAVAPASRDATRDALTGEMLDALKDKLRERETKRRRPARVPENYSKQLYNIMHHEND